MKTKKTPLLLVLGFSLLLAACKATPEPSEEDAVAQVYTSVAETLAARPTNTQAPTATLVPTATETPVTPTLAQLPTQAETKAPLVVATEVPCQNAVFMSDVTIPDGTTFAPGATFVKTWKIFNGGSCAWKSTYALSFVSGEQMSGVATALGADVAANQSAEISVSMTAPLKAGSYSGYWQLTDETGKKFGNAIYVQIVVLGATATETAGAPTATLASATETATETPVPTAATP